MALAAAVLWGTTGTAQTFVALHISGHRGRRFRLIVDAISA